VVWPVRHAREGAAVGVRWPRGALVHGPSGTGKTLMVRAVAAEAGAAVVLVTAATVTGAYLGESEERLRDAVAEAEGVAAGGTPCVVFLDDLETLCPPRSASRQQESRVVAQLLTLMDGAGTGGGGAGGAPVVFVGATSRPSEVDAALRRPGRLERDVPVGVPGPADRAAILALLASRLPLAEGVDVAAVAARLHGFTGADLGSLCREAVLSAVSGPAGPGAPVVTAAHLDEAAGRVRPSLTRGLDAEVAPVSWDDVGGAAEAKRRLRQAVEWPLRHPDAMARMGLAPPRGVLLYGPPGCSKTTLARAAASASGTAFVPLSCAQLFSRYLGEGESLLRDAFRRARLAAPSIVFLDEADALAGRRTAEDASG